MSIATSNPRTTRLYNLEAQMRENTRAQAELRHKLLFSRYPHHQTPEGQKMLSDLLDTEVRVGRQIRADIAALESQIAENRPAEIAAWEAAVASWGVVEGPIGLDGRSTAKEA